MKNYHVTKAGSSWILKAASSSEALLKKGTKTELVSSLAAYFKKKGIVGSVKIHTVDGKIQEERTYPASRDPHKSKG